MGNGETADVLEKPVREPLGSRNATVFVVVADGRSLSQS